MDKKLLAVICGIVLLAALPLVCQLTKEPEPLTADAIKQAFRDRNFSVANERPVSRPGYQADAEAFMTINGAEVHLFTYSNVGVIDAELTNMEVEAESRLPGYASKNVATAVRNKHYAILIISESVELRERIANMFLALRNPGPPPAPPEQPTRRRQF